MIVDPLALVGTTIADKYRVEAAVGEGGFAIVYKATHLVWQRPVALKVFRALGEVPKEQRDAVMEGFIAEGRLLADLSERSAVFVQSRDVATLVTADGQWMPYLVLEWLEGRTLEDFLAARNEAAGGAEVGSSMNEMMELLQPIAEGLAIAHARGVAHRDVKPSNIFLVGQGGDRTAKLLDLGIAKVVQDAQADVGAFKKTTGTMTSFTPMYGSPEQFSRSNGPTGPWTDVFALALVMLEVMAGRYALNGDDLTQIAWSACNPMQRPTPRSLGLPVTDEVESVFLRALAVQTQDRFASVGEMWEALRLATGMGAPVLRGPSSSQLPVPLTTSSSPRSVGTPMLGGQPAPFVPPAAPVAAASTGAGRGGSSVGIAVGLLGALALGGGAFFFLGRRAAAPAPPPVSTTANTSSPSAAPSGSAPLVTAEPRACPADMIRIPGGLFYMGSDEKDPTLPAGDQPAHQVKLAPYCMDRFEVKTSDYVAMSNQSLVKKSSGKNDFDGLKDSERETWDSLCTSRDAAKFADYPINCVDWNMATDFCTKSGKHLPTEAEWEFAARGPDQRKYPWGDDDPGPGLLNACGSECVAWGKQHKVTEVPMYTTDDGFPNSAPVGSFPKGKSRYGVEDVVGNVWEWTADWFAPYGADAASKTEENPTGPATGKRRVIRGGAWNGGYASWVRPSLRYHDDPAHTSYGVGFRCAK